MFLQCSWRSRKFGWTLSLLYRLSESSSLWNTEVSREMMKVTAEPEIVAYVMASSLARTTIGSLPKALTQAAATRRSLKFIVPEITHVKQRRPIHYSARVLSSSTSPRLLCPSCSKPLATPLPACTSCWHIETRPIATGSKYNLYELLNVPSQPNPFLIDEKQLKNNFRNAQSTCHPDTWASRGEVSSLFLQVIRSIC